MKRHTNRKFRLGYVLKTSGTGQKPQTYRRQVKSRIIDLIEASSAAKYYISVLYGKDKRNEGEYTNKTDTIFALNVFTEKPLLDFMEGW